MVRYSGIMLVYYICRENLIELACSLDSVIKEQNTFSACECHALLHLHIILCHKNYISVMNTTSALDK